MSWQLRGESRADDQMKARWNGLHLVLRQIVPSVEAFVPVIRLQPDLGLEDVTNVERWSDQLAQIASTIEWSPQLSRFMLMRLAGKSPAFRDSAVPREIKAREAERLVLGLDRLVGSLNADPRIKAARPELDRLFSLVQSLPGFDSEKFADALDQFQSKLPQDNR
jgi:hypothetical protein